MCFSSEIAKLVLGVDFLQLEDDNLTKRLFKKTIVDTKNMLLSFPDHRYFDALENSMLAEWSHATLLSILRDDNLDVEIGGQFDWLLCLTLCVDTLTMTILRTYKITDALAKPTGKQLVKRFHL